MAPSQSSSIRLQSPRELKAMIFWGSSLKARLKSSIAPWKSPWSFRSSPRLLVLRREKTREKKRGHGATKKAGTWEQLKHTNWLITSFLEKNKSQSLTASWCFAENLLFKIYTSLLFTNDLCSKDSNFFLRSIFSPPKFLRLQNPPKTFHRDPPYRMHQSCALVHVAVEASRPSSSHQKLPGHRPEEAWCGWLLWIERCVWCVCVYMYISYCISYISYRILSL